MVPNVPFRAGASTPNGSPYGLPPLRQGLRLLTRPLLRKGSVPGIAAAIPAAQGKEGNQAMTKLTEASLHHFTGSEHWYRHGLNRSVLFTDGAKYLADMGGAHWLLDAIAICQRFESKVAAETFQLWTLKVNADRTAILTCDDGNGTIVYTRLLDYNDFPLSKIKLYFTDNTILLPSEY
jgi:hypothetical protein